jgi:hypothetical protein
VAASERSSSSSWATRYETAPALIRVERASSPGVARWLERAEPSRLFMTEPIVLEKLRLGMSPWDTGRGGLSSAAGARRGVRIRERGGRALLRHDARPVVPDATRRRRRAEELEALLVR